MMDFLDPKKSRAYTIRLFVGYVLISIAIVLAATVLLYLASGFNVKQGKVIQNGLVFVSSNPGGASIYLNDKKQDSQTNARLTLEAGSYKMRLARDGYRDWNRALTVEGGSVEHFDYPFLIPNDLKSKVAASYQSTPLLATQSPDRRWMLIQTTGANFDVYDIRDPKTITEHKTTATIPASLFTLSQSGDQTLELAEWSRNNTHVLLKHTVNGQVEYILFSYQKPEESVNLTKQLHLTQAMSITLQDKKYDHYFEFDKNAQTLGTATLTDATVKPLLTGVLQYKTYGSDVVLYTTQSGARDGEVTAKLYQDGKSYAIRSIAKQDIYLLDVTTYDGDWYVALGAPSEGHVYVYRNPVDKLKQNESTPLIPVEVLKVDGANYLEFSANSQFVMTENDRDIAVYDAENERSYTYRLDRPVDAPQKHVTWMDGSRLSFVSNGAASIVDYDGANIQTLTVGGPAYTPFFDTTYKTLYVVAPGAQSTSWSLLSASLRTDRDQ
jgi:hypothetical protein